MKVSRSGSPAGAPRILIPVVATLALILLPSLAMDGQRAAVPPGPYVVTDLGTFGGVQSAQASDINDAGQVVGAARTHAFLWQNGVTATKIFVDNTKRFVHKYRQPCRNR